MRQKGLAVILIIIILGLSIILIAGGFFLSQKKEANFVREYPQVIKGNWEPSSFHMATMLREDVDRIKELGVNTVSVSVEYSLNKDGTPNLRGENDLIQNIIKAKENGLAVLVSPNFVGPGGHNFKEEGINITQEEYLQISEALALKWAAIAEKYKVEFFAPQNEFNGMIGGNFAQEDKEIAQITSRWHKQLLPKIKAVFSGKTMMKLSTVQEGIEATGYDLVGITIFHGNDSLAEFKERIISQYQTVKKVVEKSQNQWLISEAWFAYGGPFFQSTKNRAGESLDELQDDYFQISLDEYLKMTAGKPVGYVFIAWIMPGMDIKNRPAEKVISEYFAKF